MAVAISPIASPSMTDDDRHVRVSAKGFMPVAFGTGFYDGFFGPGAGQFYATTLVALRGLGLTRATGLTKFYNVLSNIASILVFAWGGHIYWLLGLCIGWLVWLLWRAAARRWCLQLRAEPEEEKAEYASGGQRA